MSSSLVPVVESNYMAARQRSISHYEMRTSASGNDEERILSCAWYDIGCQHVLLQCCSQRAKPPHNLTTFGESCRLLLAAKNALFAFVENVANPRLVYMLRFACRIG
jgi:hypothetical protein